MCHELDQTTFPVATWPLAPTQPQPPVLLDSGEMLQHEDSESAANERADPSITNQLELCVREVSSPVPSAETFSRLSNPKRFGQWEDRTNEKPVLLLLTNQRTEIYSSLSRPCCRLSRAASLRQLPDQNGSRLVNTGTEWNSSNTQLFAQIELK